MHYQLYTLIVVYYDCTLTFSYRTLSLYILAGGQAMGISLVAVMGVFTF